jgi:hypothetical protein
MLIIDYQPNLPGTAAAAAAPIARFDSSSPSLLPNFVFPVDLSRFLLSERRI